MKKSNGIKCLGITLLTFGFLVALIGTALAAGGPRSVTVDARKPIGFIHSLQGGHWDPGPAGEPLSDNYKAVGIDAIRTHDAGGFDPGPPTGGEGDIDGIGYAVIFPDLDADPNDPASYNFGPTDALIKNIRDIGAEVFFRVGRSNLGFFGNNYVPPDFDKYAEIVKHVVLHYNYGWADGFHYGIRYWEIWNEPDLLPFWIALDDPSQYHELYKKISLAIKSVCPWAKIGGPASVTKNDFTGLEESLMQFCVDNNLPMDFYSYHHYPNHSVDPFDNARLGQRYRDLLDDYGFRHAEVVNSEYGNHALDGTPLIGGDVAGAIFTAQAQMHMQDSPVDQVYVYMHVEEDTLSKTNNAFRMVSTLNRTPLSLLTSGGDDTGFAVMAGRRFIKRELRVLISNYEISPANMGDPIPGLDPYNTEEVVIPGLGTLGTWVWLPRRTIAYENTEGYNLDIRNIPLWWGDLKVEQYRIDLENNMTLVDSWTIDKFDRFWNQSVTVSGEWAHDPNPDPELDPNPDGVAQGIDMIVVTGHWGGHHCPWYFH